MELKTFEDLVALTPKLKKPLRVAVAGGDSPEILQGLFRAQREGLVKPVLVAKKGRIPAMLESLGLQDEPYKLIETEPNQSVAGASIDVIRYGDADILMRGNVLGHDLLTPMMDPETGLRDGQRIISHVTLASMPEYPKLIAMSDMAVILYPDISKKRAIIRNTAEALHALGYEKPKLAMLSVVEKGNFRMQDTVEAQSLVYEQSRTPFVNAQLWGPISYDLIISPEAARQKKYECPWTGGGFDGIIAPELTTANTLLKSWLIHARSTVCGALMGARVPVAFTSRFTTPEEAYLSIIFALILHEAKNKQD